MDLLRNIPAYAIKDLSMDRGEIDNCLSTLMHVQKSIPEFERPYSKEELIKRLYQSPGNCLILVSSYDITRIGFVVSYNKELESSENLFSDKPLYDKHVDNDLYIWIGGVSPDHRREGIMSSLLDITEWWAVEIGYSQLSLKTYPNFVNMQKLVKKRDFNKEPNKKLEDSIIYSKDISSISPTGFSHSNAYKNAKNKNFSIDLSWNIVPPWIR